MNKVAVRFVGIGLTSLVLSLILLHNDAALSEIRLGAIRQEQDQQPFQPENSGIGNRNAAPTAKMPPLLKHKNGQEMPQVHPNSAAVVPAKSDYVSPASAFSMLQEGQGTLDIAARGVLHRTTEGCLTWTFTREQGRSYPVVVLQIPDAASEGALWPIEREIMVGGWLGSVAEGVQLSGQVSCIHQTSDVFWLTGIAKG